MQRGRRNQLAAVAANAGGVRAPLEASARLRGLLLAELVRGERELRETRSGYGSPLAMAFAPAERAVVAACPVRRELRADAAAAPDRAWFVVAAAVGALAGTTALPPPATPQELMLLAGELDGHLALSWPMQSGREAEAAELAAALYDERMAGVDRLRTVAVPLPAVVLAGVDDLKRPPSLSNQLHVAEAVARLGGDPADDESVELYADALIALLEPAGTAARAHDDPHPVRRIARRILQRLDGMGKWGGYHTEFPHLARGFGPGNEQALAAEVGEALLAAGLLEEKRSVGQRHVFLNPRRSGDIRRLIDSGELPQGLRLPG